MTEGPALFAILRQSADPAVVSALEHLVESGPDPELNRINAIAYADRNGFDQERVIGALLHASRIGLFDMSWNVLCPGCGGVLHSGATLKSVNRAEYSCALCAAGYEPTLDEMVEVTFTVSPRIRRIAAHDPDSLSVVDYARQMMWSSGVDLPEDLVETMQEIMLDSVELPPGERALLSLQLPPGFVILFDPVTHAAQFLNVAGEPIKERQALTIVLNDVKAQNETIELRPGPLRVSVENRASRRALPGLWVADDRLHNLLGRRRPFLTAKRLLSNQTFRDIYRTDTLDIDQRLKITSLTFLFTDLKGSTELYERVGDLVAYDLVRAHFHLLTEIVAAEGGAVVKTIGDAVMATFPTPMRGLAAALGMRDAMRQLSERREGEDLLLKIGIHEGPCLAVTLNERQDYFGQTVNIAARVQNLAMSRSIFVTGAVAEDPESRHLLGARGLVPTARHAALRGIHADTAIYEIP